MNYIIDLTVLNLLQLCGYTLLDEVDASCLHVIAYLVGQLLVKSAEEDGPHHDSRVNAHAMEEAGTFQADVAGTNKKGLACINRDELVSRLMWN